MNCEPLKEDGSSKPIESPLGMGLNTLITKIIAYAQGRTLSFKMTDELRVQKNVPKARRTDYVQGIP